MAHSGRNPEVDAEHWVRDSGNAKEVIFLCITQEQDFVLTPGVVCRCVL
jgi:hypothetical protein